MVKPKILFENERVVVVNKPSGINVHLGYGREHEKTLVHIVAARAGRGIFPVHRLDRDTSGVLIFAKNESTRDYLQQQFKDRIVKKTYLTLVKGVPKLSHAILDWPIGRHPQNPMKRAVRPQGKPAQTEYKIKQTFGNRNSLLEVYPKTGRTHQIRVHLAKLGHPIIGDKLYGKGNPALGRQWLHAQRLELRLPDGKVYKFSAPIPKVLAEFIKQL